MNYARCPAMKFRSTVCKRAMIAMKLPIGLSALSLLGLILFFARDLPSEWNFPAGVILAAVLLFLLVLSQAATHAGIRHALPVVVLLSIFAGLFVERALASSSRIPKTIVLGAQLALALVLSMPADAASGCFQVPPSPWPRGNWLRR
jgi:hypothetical protein